MNFIFNQLTITWIHAYFSEPFHASVLWASDCFLISSDFLYCPLFLGILVGDFSEATFDDSCTWFYWGKMPSIQWSDVLEYWFASRSPLGSFFFFFVCLLSRLLRLSFGGVFDAISFSYSKIGAWRLAGSYTPNNWEKVYPLRDSFSKYLIGLEIFAIHTIQCYKK
jgi:hypothetical protein